MKKTILTSLLFLGLLVGCSTPKPSVSDSVSESTPVSVSESASEVASESAVDSVSESVSEVASESTVDSVSESVSEVPSESVSEVPSEIVSSESVSEVPSESVSSESVSESEEDEDTEPLPTIPEDSGPVAGEGLANGTIKIEGAIPEGWVYISNDPVKFPNPEFYKDGGLKLNFYPMALKSPTFAASAKTVVIAGKLNENTRTGGAASTLSVYTVSGSTETLVRSAVFSAKKLTTFSESYSLPAGTTQFVIKLIANVGYNININTITIS